MKWNSRNKKELWLRLCNYQFEDLVTPNMWDQIAAKLGGRNASVKAFAGKLARKHGWNEAFALRAIAEYRKFVYLGVISDFVVTPSDVIDKVWHQHILFSKAYRNFCRDVISYEFDHNPELFPLEGQIEQYQKQYYHTLQLYKQEFGKEATASIWGHTKFDEALITSQKKDMSMANDGGSLYFGDVPLYQSFDAGEDFNDYDNGYSDNDGGADSSDASGDSGSCSSCSSGCSSCGGGD
jgi:hypothetical protein